VFKERVRQAGPGLDQAGDDRPRVTSSPSVDLAVCSKSSDEQLDDLIVGIRGQPGDDLLNKLEALGLHRLIVVAAVANQSAPAVVDYKRKQRLHSAGE